MYPKSQKWKLKQRERIIPFPSILLKWCPLQTPPGCRSGPYWAWFHQGLLNQPACSNKSSSAFICWVHFWPGGWSRRNPPLELPCRAGLSLPHTWTSKHTQVVSSSQGSQWGGGWSSHSWPTNWSSSEGPTKSRTQVINCGKLIALKVNVKKM